MEDEYPVFSPYNPRRFAAIAALAVAVLLLREWWAIVNNAHLN